MIIITLLLLAMMEIALSFDNAVLNAGVLKNMSPQWQTRFLTWGMPVAVLGMRLVFPVLIVAVAGGLSIPAVVNLAISHPEEYAQQLSSNHVNISAFGGMFLLLVFLNFILNPEGERRVYWLTWLEQRFTKVGLLKGIEIVIALTALATVQYFVPGEPARLSCLLSGLVGVGLYVLLEAAKGIFDLGIGCPTNRGIMGFIYLEVLDASCSLDGVIGAFVLTNNILLIMIGLGIGSLTIRSLTLYLVRGGALQEFIYLEHGAHYGIGALATIMLIDTFHSVPEPITGSLGILFIALSMWSSLRERKKLFPPQNRKIKESNSERSSCAMQ